MVSHDRRFVIGKDAGIAGRLPALSIVTPTRRLIASWLVML
jgi:hypothetical protein